MLTLVLVGLIATLHLYFLILEMFLWDTAYGRRVFGLTKETAHHSKKLAMNQGLYNGFLAAGLIWGLSQGVAGKPTLTFFLSCIVMAGIFGGCTANKRIFYVQALPALVTLILLFYR